MARAATTSDVFNAVAEPGRRDILDVLADGELSVGDLVSRLGLPQPVVSKHLAVLRAVDLVSVRVDGRSRLYRVNATALTPMYHWLTRFERLWSERLDRFEDVLAELREDNAPRRSE
ncbi:metalloregulator ArsR/SmtB family transcription factor [Microlunatus panaciterrae]|uniref:DNA-binding transcriptional ArsR family regulator n=1 Tax=Microlunatus panaciterrae TaxID=400768 RepID=A0ABS2RIQ5_9ACTN|nr:DNA-binding transcriptional ArsR family regulator [Microlunatus panaciterrae]